MSTSVVAVGTYFPAIDSIKKRLIKLLASQWLVCVRVPDSQRYRVFGIFLHKEDAEMFKRALKKRDKKIHKTRSLDGPGS